MSTSFRIIFGLAFYLFSVFWPISSQSDFNQRFDQASLLADNEYALRDVSGMKVLEVPVRLVKDNDEIQVIFSLFISCAFQEIHVTNFCAKHSLSGSFCEQTMLHMKELHHNYQVQHFTSNDWHKCNANQVELSQEVDSNSVARTDDNKFILLPTRLSKRINSLLYGHNLLNPSIVQWNGLVLVAVRDLNLGERYLMTCDTIGIAIWKSMDDFESYLLGDERNIFKAFPLEDTYPCILRDSQDSSCRHASQTRTLVTGEDPRLIVVNNSLFVVYNAIDVRNNPLRLMHFAEIALDNSRAFVVGKVHIIDSSIHIPGQDQKNWVPMEYNKELVFAYSIFPHVIIKPIKYPESLQEALHCFLESDLPFVTRYSPICNHLNLRRSDRLDWLSFQIISVSEQFTSYSGTYEYVNLIQRYRDTYEGRLGPVLLDRRVDQRNFSFSLGMISGGSPAVDIGSGFKLSFFHTRVVSKTTLRFRYLMGAYVFEDRPPFRIIGLTPIALTHDEHVEGLVPTSPIETVFYPSGLVVNKGMIYMSFGVNDIKGFCVKVSLDDFLPMFEYLI